MTRAPALPFRAGRELAVLSAPATALVVCLAVLAHYSTPVPVALGYLAYLAVAVSLPGTLVWRAVRGSQVSFLEDVAIGTAIGLAAQALVAFALSPLHLSHWSWLWAAAAITLSLLVPRWRRVWSRPRSVRTTALSAWVQSAAVMASAVWLGATAIAHNPVAYIDGWGPWSRGVPSSAYVDLPFHQAIAAGIQGNHALVYPYLYDVPLQYHLFVYEHLASASSDSRIDLTWLLYRLDPVMLVALGIVLAGVLTRRLSGAARSAPLATVVVTLSSAVSVYGWTHFPFQNPGFLHFATYRSPTQTFGIPLFLAAMTAATMLLRGRRLRARLPLLLVFAVLALGAGGSKSTFLPVLVCGLLLALATSLVVRRGRWRPALTLVAVAGAGFAFVVLVLLGGKSGSLSIAPLNLLGSMELAQRVADLAIPGHERVILVLALASWLSVAIGAMLLLSRRALHDPAGWLVAGVAVAGVAGSLLTSANGLSQLYFLYAAWPMLGILTAWGLVKATAPSPRRGVRLAAGALAAGAALLWLVARVDGSTAPVRVVPALPYRAIGGPWLLLLAASVTLALAVGLIHRSRRATVLTTWTVMGVTFVGLIAGAGLSLRSSEVVSSLDQIVSGVPEAPEGYAIDRDGALAALYVRDHAGPDDVVATNAHCYGPVDACDARHFWISALTERRVLVEGWAYPEGFRPGQTRTSAFWDTTRYDENQVVFSAPTRENVALLADTYGVRWLFVDRSIGVESPDLRQFATLVVDTPGAAVYRIG